MKKIIGIMTTAFLALAMSFNNGVSVNSNLTLDNLILINSASAQTEKYHDDPDDGSLGDWWGDMWTNVDWEEWPTACYDDNDNQIEDAQDCDLGDDDCWETDCDYANRE